MKITISVSTCWLLFAASLFASSLQEQNKAIAKRAFEEILSRGRFVLAEELYAKDFINHWIDANASLKEYQTSDKGWDEALPDVSIIHEKLIAEYALVTSYSIVRETK